MKKFKFPETIKKLANVFHENSFELFVVGGAVRDYFAGNVVKDYDFATNALPEQVVSLFAHTIPTGIEHGTVTVVLKGNSYEVTTYRSEGTYKNSRHPEEVHFIGNITEDLKRRDFTINALAVNTSTGELLDYHKGLLDLQNKVIRAIGNPSQRFREDSLRMLRAFRFSAVLGFTIEKETLDAIQFCSSEIIHISSERIKEELNKILSAEYPSNTLSSMNSIGILTNVLPELSECESIGEKGSNKIDTFRHLCLSCDGAPNSNLIVRWAALLHDIGKPSAEIININGTTAYHGHDRISGDLADSVLRRLKFSNVFRKEVVHLISNHMFNYSEDWTDAAVRRFISRVGIQYVHNLILLREADYYGTTGIKKPIKLLYSLIDRVNILLQDDTAVQISDLAISGSDLINSGMKQGPVIGTILQLLLEAVIDDPAQNTRQTLIPMAIKMYNSYRMI